jgi:hypothetical protein
MVLMLSCEKQLLNSNSLDGEKKFGAVMDGVKKPAKGEMFSIPRFDLAPMQCAPGSPSPGGMYMGGWGTGTEEIQLMQSPFFMDGCEFDGQNMIITSWGHGTVTVENGDSYNITGRVKHNLANMTFTGDVKIIDGTGKYKGAFGEVKMYDGWVDMNTGKNYWKYDGWIVFKK